MPVLPGILGAIARSAPKPKPSGEGIFDFLSGLAGSVIPGIGAASSAALQRKWALLDRDFQNEYNTPANQLKRLKEAGLPAAAFFSGGVSSQSDQPRSVNVDPTLGAAEGMSNFFKNRFQNAQLRLLDAQTRQQNATADEAEGRTAILKSPMDNYLGGTSTFQGVQMSTHLGKEQADKAAADAGQMIANQVAASNENDILGALKRGELDKLLTGNDILRQIFADNKLFLDFKRDLANRLNSGFNGDSFGDILKDLLGPLYFRILGGVRQ